jgi:hypothetical protein
MKFGLLLFAVFLGCRVGEELAIWLVDPYPTHGLLGMGTVCCHNKEEERA